MKKILVTLLMSFSTLLRSGTLPDPASGGKDGKPMDILFLRGNVEIGFGEPIPIDGEYVGKLEELGYKVHVARDFNPLTEEYLRQFNIVVWINPSPYSAGSRYFGPDSWQGGMHMGTVRKNAGILERYVAAGGGLLVNPAIEEIGMPVSESHRILLKPYGMETECAQVRDKRHEFEFERISKKFPMFMSWTDAILDHPVAEGVRRIYYPAYTMRWDDNVTTVPLYPKDPAWIPFVKAMPEATVSWYRGTPYELGHWKDAEGRDTPVIAAGRDYMQGRIAVVGVCHFHLFYYPYSSKKNHAECYFGAQDGKLMEKGFDGAPSDMAKLLDNLYRWLSVPGVKLGFGGYDANAGLKLAEIPKQPVGNVSEVWADKDPMNTGKVRPMKILVGARSEHGGGRGSVEEYAQAAGKAGVDVIAFTDRFEDSDEINYGKFVEECKKYSSEKVFLLPGVDVEDSLGNRFLLLGLDSPIRPHLLVEKEADSPGKKLIWTGHMLLGMGEVLPVVARPQQLNAPRENGQLPPDLYSHCPGVALATYRGGDKVDDGLFAYRWSLFNASLPIPVAVHEVFSPDELEAAAANGLQCYVNADSPEHAAFYFRQGHMSAGGNPMRYYVSSGPLIDSASIDDWRSEHWTIRIKAHDGCPITGLTACDQAGAYRNFTTSGDTIDVSFSGNLGSQRWFLIELVDQNGGKAFLSPIRSLPERHFIRCIDRQNWFGNLNFRYLTYTGRTRSLPATGATISLPGIKLGSDPCPKLQLKYIGPGHTVTEYDMDMLLVPGARDPGADNAPIFNAIPNEFYNGKIRYVFYSTPGGKGSMPEIIQSMIDFEILQDMKPTGDVWPVIGKADQVKPGSKYISADGQEGVLAKNGFADLPAGGAVGNIIALTPMRVSDKGLLGFANSADSNEIRKGTTYHAEFITVPPDKVAEIRRAIGFDGKVPYGFSMTQGKLEKAGLTADFAAENYGMAGDLKGVSNDCWWNGKRFLPLRAKGVRKNWPVGLWNKKTGAIQSFDVFEGVAMGALNPTEDCGFYFGNLLIASDERVCLSFASDWSGEGARIEVHNPTDADLTVKIDSPGAITGKQRISVELEIGAGQTKYIATGMK